MVRLEKIEYKAVSVRELLVGMKDLSELMIDLAYSSALFHDRELAEEVLKFEEHVGTLAYLLGMNAMVAVRDAADAESLVGVSMVATSVEKIADAAADIATLVLREIGVHPIVREAFKETEEKLGRAEVKSNSILVGKKIGDLDLAATMGVDIIAIRRVREWIINPSDNEKIKDSDILLTRGAQLGVEELKGIAQGTIKKLEKQK